MELLPVHKKQWQQFQHIITNQRMAQSILLVGAANCALKQFIQRIMALSLCKQPTAEPCQQCQHCRLISANEHPDIHWVKPEKAGGSLKVEQIRRLQTQAYTTPKTAGMQFFIIEAAEQMNKSVANALLKVLEEPSEYTRFIVVAEHLSRVLPTVISRCQIWRFNMDTPEYNLLELIDTYPDGSSQKNISEHTTSILEGLIKLTCKTTLPTVLASQFKSYELKDLLWLMYLIFAQLIRLSIQKKPPTGAQADRLNQLLLTLKLENLFYVLGKITVLQEKISHNLNVNQLLALEDLLIAIVSDARETGL